MRRSPNDAMTVLSMQITHALGLADNSGVGPLLMKRVETPVHDQVGLVLAPQDDEAMP